MVGKLLSAIALSLLMSSATFASPEYNKLNLLDSNTHIDQKYNQDLFHTARYPWWVNPTCWYIYNGILYYCTA
jgi:hypothetical protein